MILAAALENGIHKIVGELHELVNIQGCELSNHDVVKKSMELDLLILEAMLSQENVYRKMKHLKLSHRAKRRFRRNRLFLMVLNKRVYEKQNGSAIQHRETSGACPIHRMAKSEPACSVVHIIPSVQGIPCESSYRPNAERPP